MKHAQTYQQMPWCLARISEPTGPVFLRAFLSFFYPELAEESSVRVGGVLDGEDLFSFHIGLQDQTSEEVVEYLATAVSMQEVQLCYERLLELSVEVYAKEESERAKLKSKAARNGSRVNTADKEVATAVEKDCLSNRRCFSLGFRELCDEPDGKFLSQVLRVAQTGLTIAGTVVPEVEWGKKCSCGEHHSQTCWFAVARLYEFLKSEFFHVYVHQMLAEGCFNILDHNQKNASSELRTAGLQVKVCPCFRMVGMVC